MSSVTFHAVVISSNKRRDGTYPVKIRVTFKGVSRRLPTTLIARPSDLTRSLHIKSADITSKANELIARMQGVLSEVSQFVLEEWDVDRAVAFIRSRMQEQTFRLDFFQFADGYLNNKTPSTRRAYDMALGAMQRFLGKRSLEVNDITKRMLMEFVEYIDAEPKIHYDPRTKEWKKTEDKKGVGAASRHLMKLAHIFNAAKTKYNDDDKVLIPRSPFDGIPRNYGQSEGQKALPVEVLQTIINADAEGWERIALDAFVVSFGLMGANLADLYSARKFSGEVWEYRRQKTSRRRADGARMRVTIPAQIRPYLKRLETGAEWWLGELHRAGSKDLCTAKINAALKRWAGRAGIDPFTFYAARKSWATLARRAGVEKATIDECLAHKGDFAIADIYIEKSWELLDAANARTLSTLQFPQ